METENTVITLEAEIEEIIREHTDEDTSHVCCEALKKMFNV